MYLIEDKNGAGFRLPEGKETGFTKDREQAARFETRALAITEARLNCLTPGTYKIVPLRDHPLSASGEGY